MAGVNSPRLQHKLILCWFSFRSAPGSGPAAAALILGFGHHMRGIARFIGFVFATCAILFVIAVAAIWVVITIYQKDLPDYTQLQNYEPPVMTRVHAGD